MSDAFAVSLLVVHAREIAEVQVSVPAGPAEFTGNGVDTPSGLVGRVRHGEERNVVTLFSSNDPLNK